jgi:FkbM family methyltransferase
MRLIDCGAFVGDTLASISELGLPVASVHAFEPDLTNVASLAGFARDFSLVNGAEVSVWPCAVADHIEHRSFQAAAGEASSFSAAGDDVVTAVALDDVLPNAVPTDLKLDIEGAELDALRGARELITRSHPRLAVCVYHRPEHLWEIPLFVRDMGPWYDFYLRSHGHYGFDTVMYAVPRAAA